MRVTVALSRKDTNKVFTVDFALKNKAPASEKDGSAKSTAQALRYTAI